MTTDGLVLRLQKVGKRRRSEKPTCTPNIGEQIALRGHGAVNIIL